MQVHFHDDDAVHQTLLGQVAQFARIVQIRQPQHQVIALLPGGVGSTGDELEFCEAQAAFGRGKEERDDAAALAGQAARQGVGSIAQLVHGGKDALAGLFGNRPRAIQCVGDRADRHAGTFGHIYHSRHSYLV